MKLEKKIGRRALAILLACGFVFIFAGVVCFGYAFEYEYPFTLTVWVAKQTKIPDGERVVDLIKNRSDNAYVEQYWHHCTWCDVVYPHAPHLAIKVGINNDDRDFYLFDWNLSERKLTPITVRTAKVFPELISAGCVVVPLGVGMNPQLYHNDEPCRIVPPNLKITQTQNPAGAAAAICRAVRGG